MSRPTGGKKYFQAIGRRECAMGLPITYQRELYMWLPTWALRERAAGFWQQSTIGFSQNSAAQNTEGAQS